MDFYRMLSRWVQQFPERCALSFEGRTWTFTEFLLVVDRTAELLRRQGIARGSIVAYWSKNDPSFFFVAFACTKLGAVFAPMNFRLAPAEAKAIVAEIGAAGVVAEPAYAASLRAEGLPGSLPLLTTTETSDAGDLAGDDEFGCAADVTLADPALILFTSGTTGRPRGVQLTHSNVWYGTVNVMIGGDFRRDDVILQMAPLSAVATWPWSLATWLKGGELALLESVDAERFLRIVPERRVTSLAPVVALLVSVAAHPDFDTADLSSMRWIVPGGAALSDELRTKFTSKGVEIRLAYGMTETTGMAAFLTAHLTASKPGAAGFPMLLTEIRVVDEDGEDVPQGEGGEVWLRGPNITETIWVDGQPTNARDADGWMHTGDVGRFDEDGVLFIVDRLKDMIKSGGENVYSAEVERVLARHPAVAEVAIVGAPDERWGETVVACVVPEPGATVTVEELREFGARFIARYKLPTRVVLFEELAKTSSGKVQKPALRERVARLAVEA
jgi:fatty-acyl-CoA synthase